MSPHFALFLLAESNRNSLLSAAMSSPFRFPTLPGLDAMKPHWTSLFNPITLPKQLQPLKDACIAVRPRRRSP